MLVQGILDGSLGITFEALVASPTGCIDLGCAYAPFNMVLVRLGSGGAPSAAVFLSNVERGESEAVVHGAWASLGELSGGRAARVTCLPPGVHVVGNVPGFDDLRWGKIAWVHGGLTAAAAAAVAAAGAGPLPAAGAVERFAAPFLRVEPLEPLLKDFEFSRLPPAKEEFLQSHIVIPWGKVIEDYGSRILMCIVHRAAEGGGEAQGEASASSRLAWMEMGGENPPWSFL
jgi:hypothetical protein